MSEVSTKSRMVLIAEDNEVNQKVLRAILDRSGFAYDIANDGKEAVAKYHSGEYAIVLMDCQMPLLDGLGATKVIRTMELENKKGRCPIVALTANAMRGDRERCLAAGMDDFLSKPFKSKELIDLISQWTNGGAR